MLCVCASSPSLPLRARLISRSPLLPIPPSSSSSRLNEFNYKCSIANSDVESKSSIGVEGYCRDFESDNSTPVVRLSSDVLRSEFELLEEEEEEEAPDTKTHSPLNLHVR